MECCRQRNHIYIRKGFAEDFQTLPPFISQVMTLIEAQCSKICFLKELNNIHVFKIKVLVLDHIIRILYFRVAFQTINGTVQVDTSQR